MDIKDLKQYETTNRKILKIQQERKELNKKHLAILKEEEKILSKMQRNETFMCYVVEDTKAIAEIKKLYKMSFKENAEEQKTLRALIKESQTVITDITNELKRIEKYKKGIRKNAK